MNYNFTWIKNNKKKTVSLLNLHTLYQMNQLHFEIKSEVYTKKTKTTFLTNIRHLELHERRQK